MRKSNKIGKHNVYRILLYTLLFNLSAVTAFAQYNEGRSFLLISPSPQSNAMGETYGNNISEDPMAAVFNPASLGLFAQNFYFGTSFYPKKSDWFNNPYSCNSTGIGLNLKKKTGLPLSIGIGYNHIFLDLGKQIIIGEDSPEPIGEFESWEKATSITFAVAVDYYVRVSFGYSNKSIKSHLAPVGAGEEQRSGDAKANAYDLGFIVQIPVFEISRKLNIISTETLVSLQPFFNASLIYNLNNVGEKITYIDAAQADMLPRNVSTGVNLDAGLRYIGKKYYFDLISFKWTREAADLLIETNSEYVSGLNDINFTENVLLGKANDKITTKKGWEHGFGDFFFIRRGRYYDPILWSSFKTGGWGINFLQPFRIYFELKKRHIDNFFVNLLLKFDIEYHTSEYLAQGGQPLAGTKFKGLIIRLKNQF